MRKIAVLAIMLLAAISLKAQMVPNDAEIELLVKDPSSQYYYTALMDRYEEGDTTLTVEDYHYLYYGYVYQDRYDPWATIAAEVEMARLLTANRDDLAKVAGDIVAKGREVMEADPFSMSNINLMAYASNLAGDVLGETVNGDRLFKLAAVIGMSGDGRKENTPWHVTRFSHVNDFLALRGLEASKRTVVTRDVEYVDLKENSGRIKGYYFDSGRVYLKPREVQTEQNRGIGVNQSMPYSY